MRIIDVPQTVKVPFKHNDGTPAPREYPFRDFLTAAIDNHKPFGIGVSGVRQGMKIAEKVEKLPEAGGVVMRLEDAEYEALKVAVENCGFHPLLARTCMVYFEAVEKAQQVDATQEISPAKKQ